jgi:hypothetical protein
MRRSSAGASCSESARAASSRLRLIKVATFNQPLYVTGAPGDRQRLFVVQKPGQIEVRDHGVSHEFLHISKLVTSGGSEQGLLSMALRPTTRAAGVSTDYTGAPHCRVRSTASPSDNRSSLTGNRYSVSGNRYSVSATAASGVATWKLKLSSRYRRTTSRSWSR